MSIENVDFVILIFYRLEKEEWVQELPWACARSKTASVFSIWKRCTTRCSLVVAGENLYEGAEGRPHEYFSSPSQSQQVEAAADRECSDDKNLSTSFISVMRIATEFKYWKFKRLEITPFFIVTYCNEVSTDLTITGGKMVKVINFTRVIM